MKAILVLKLFLACLPLASFVSVITQKNLISHQSSRIETARTFSKAPEKMKPMRCRLPTENCVLLAVQRP